MVVEAQKETLNFQTEVKQLMRLMIHSLYSNKEIFLRELISNASDALDKLRFGALEDAKLSQKNRDLKIEIDVDKDARTITISDNGIGMTREEVIDNLGTIAKSGTREFLSTLTGDKAKDAQLIGQFGVGFYSVFMVADKVTVLTRHAGSEEDTATRWESSGEGEYTLEDAYKAEHGTTIIVHLKKDEDEFLDNYRVRGIITTYSDHIAFPVMMKKEVPTEKISDDEKIIDVPVYEAVNRATALWTRNKSDISEQEYEEFYKHVSHDFENPLAWAHNRVEGKAEYVSLLYVPKRPPFDMWNREKKHGIKLYVQRVFIMDDAEQFLPNYLRFTRGIVDANDLPLNVSREILQSNKQVEAIRKGLVKRILSLLADMATTKPEDYATFWQAFGEVLKEGPIEDAANREEIAKLLRFATTYDADPKQNVSLADYVSRMPSSQEKIYYVTAENLQAAQSSPHLEIFRKKNIEVLLLHHRVDEWLMSHLTEYEGKPLHSVAKGSLDLGEMEDPEEKKVQEEVDQSFKGLIEAVKKALGSAVKEVRTTHRLTESPACVVADDYELGLQMQRILKNAGQAMPMSKPILELNPYHPLVKRMQTQFASSDITDWAHLLLDQAVLAEGGELADPAAFVKRLNQLLVDGA